MSEIINKDDETKSANELILNNILRSLTMLEKALDRLMRNNFYNSTNRIWINGTNINRSYYLSTTFYLLQQ